MPKTVDLTGLRFGRLVALGRGGSGARGASLWNCQCDCGSTLIVEGRNLTRGTAANKSCGCRRAEIATRTSKTCSKCGAHKDIAEFSMMRNGQALDERHSWCRVCTREANKIYRRENAEHVREVRAAYWAANRDRLRANADAWKAANPGRHKFLQRRSHLKRMYGLTPEQYDSLLADQAGVCAICETASDERLHVDHDHVCCPGKASCGKCIRGLLCGKCNRLLGWYEKVRDRVEEYRCLSPS